MTVAPAPDSAIPARYEAFAEGFGNIVSVNADEFGHAAIGITLPASVQGETKILVRVVPVTLRRDMARQGRKQGAECRNQ